MIDPALMLEEFLFSLGRNLVTAFVVALLMFGIAVAVPPRWKWWVAFPLAVVIGLCATIAFIMIGMHLLYRLGANFAVYFGPIQLAIAVLLSGTGYAVVRWRRDPLAASGAPKPDSWYGPR